MLHNYSNIGSVLNNVQRHFGVLLLPTWCISLLYKGPVLTIDSLLIVNPLLVINSKLWRQMWHLVKTESLSCKFWDRVCIQASWMLLASESAVMEAPSYPLAPAGAHGLEVKIDFQNDFEEDGWVHIGSLRIGTKSNSRCFRNRKCFSFSELSSTL